MTGILLGGGEGVRLRPLTDDRPKVMLPIGDRPVLEHNLRMLQAAKISDIIITLYYRPEAITGYFKDGSRFGVSIRYSRQEDLRGSAGDVKRIRADMTSPFVVVYGDNFSNCSLARVLEYHAGSGGMATVVLFDAEKNPNSRISGGCARLEAGTNRILQFIEGKGSRTRYVNAGIYVLEKEVAGYIPENTAYDFGRDLFPLLVREGKEIYGYLMPEDEYLFGIDTVECYERTTAFYKNRLRKA